MNRGFGRISLITSALWLLTGCSAITGVPELGPPSLVMLVPSGPGSGSEQGRAHLVDGVRGPVWHAVDDFGLLEVWLTTSASSATTTSVTLPDSAGAGDFTPTTKSPPAWVEEKRGWQQAVMTTLDQALADRAGQQSGAAITSSIAQAVQSAGALVPQRAPGEPARVQVLTLGGVEHTERFHLGTTSVDDAAEAGQRAAARVVVAAEQAPRPVIVELYGIGDLSYLDPPPTQIAADGIVAFWTAFCDELNAVDVGCRVERELPRPDGAPELTQER